VCCMSKKNKKLRRLLRQKLQQQQGSNPRIDNPPRTPQEMPQTQADNQKPMPQTENIEGVETVEETKSEVLKILLTVLILIILIVIIYFVSTRTNFMLQAGEYLTKILNIKIGS